MADEVKKTSPTSPMEEPAPDSKSVAPVDFSEAGALDPAKSKLEGESPASVATDLSKEATDISNQTMETAKPQPEADEPLAQAPPVSAPPPPAAAVFQNPVTTPPPVNQAAADFGVAPAPVVVGATSPASVASVDGVNGPLPPELAGWNWGAFFWTWIWGIANSTWIALLALLGPMALVMAIYLGLKGNEMAWKNRKFASVEDFKKTQHVWAVWGLVLFILGLIIGGVAIVMAIKTGVSSSSNIITTSP